MQWINKDKHYIKKFAFLPITLHGETKWLETVYLHNQYSFTYGTIRHFITKEEYDKAQEGRGFKSVFSKTNTEAKG